MKGELKNAWGYQGNNLNLPVQEVEAAIPFYETVMGFQVLSRSDSPQKSAVLGRDDIQIGLVENGGDPEQDGCAFEVTDIESLLAEFKAKGLKRDETGFKIEYREGKPWKVFFVIAPDGLCYWLGEKQIKEGTTGEEGSEA